MKPNYLVIGSQNCGTTSLCAHLGKHPDVFMTEPKELHFFSDPEAFARGWEWYESYFSGAGSARAVGEGSTTYTRNVREPDAPERIARYLPDARLIYMVRHPLRRMETHWTHRRRLKRNPPWDFARTYKAVPWMVDCSLFWKQLNLYRDRFPDSSIHVVFFEDFVADPDLELKRCFEFLGVDSSYVVPESRTVHNPSLGRRVDKGLGRLLKKLGFVTTLWHATPLPVRKLVQPLVSTELARKPVWPEWMLADAIRRIEPDMKQFLAFFGKPEDYWRLEAQVESPDQA